MAKSFNLIPGTPDDDNLFGTDGKDLITGLEGRTFFTAARGAIDFDGGPDTSGFDYDQFFGGGGKDIFAFTTGDGTEQIEDFKLGKDGLDLSHTTFSKHDLKDIDKGGTINDSDGDGNYLRQTDANGKHEVQIFFGNDNPGFDQITIVGISVKDLRHDVKHFHDHYDFF